MKAKENKSAFLEQFGDTPQLRVLDFLISEHFFDFPLTEIARKSEVSYNSLKSFFGKFIKNNFVINTRKIGKSDYYQLNTENSIIKNIIQLAWDLTKQSLELNPLPKIKNIKLKNNSLISTQ